MTPRLKNVVAVSDAQGLDTMGSLVSSTMPNDFVKATTVVRTWAKHGLDVNDLPDIRSATHNFQSACRSVENRKRTNGRTVEVQVDEVVNTSAECVYQITRRVRDKREQVIEHPKGMTLVLDKGTEQITVRELEDYDSLAGLEEKVRKHFDKHAKDIHGEKIRNAIKDVLDRIGAQPLRKKGGLYFVPHDYKALNAGGQSVEHDTEPILRGIQGFLADMYAERADFFIIPLLAGDEQEQMVAKHFSLNVNVALEDLRDEAIQRVRAGKGQRGVRQDLLNRMWNERRRLVSAVAQYEELVNLEKSDIEANLRDLDKALADLQDLADS